MSRTFQFPGTRSIQNKTGLSRLCAPIALGATLTLSTMSLACGASDPASTALAPSDITSLALPQAPEEPENPNPICTPPTSGETYQNDFNALKNDLIWPVTGAAPTLSDYGDINSIFGIRAKVGDPHDFHRGIDMYTPVGTPVHPIMPGRLKYLSGSTLILEHDMYQINQRLGTSYSYTNTLWSMPSSRQDRFYSVYTHITPAVTPTQVQNRDWIDSTSTSIGHVIQDGSVHPHLHFEARLGYYCQYETYSDPASSCADPEDDGFEAFDPAVNPLHLFPHPEDLGSGLVARSLQANYDPNRGWVVTYTSDHRDVLLNHIQVIVSPKTYCSPLAEFTFNYDRRTGFDLDTLNSQDTSKPYFAPVSFGFNSSYQTEFVIPDSWLNGVTTGSYESILPSGHEIIVLARDIDQDQIYVRFTLDTQSGL